MKDLKKIASFILVIVAAFAIVFGVRAMNNRSVEKQLVDAELVNGLLLESVNYEGDNYIIPPTQIYSITDDKEDFPALNNPAFDSIEVADEYLADDVLGVDVEVNGDHRFYSFQILNWHLVVNDEFNGQPLAITHCIFCRAPQVFERQINGQVVNFASSNQVYNNNILLSDDRSNGLWLQMRGLGVTNENIGATLTPYHSEIITWSKWKENYPNGEALSRNTGFDFDYTSHPLQNYDIASLIYFPVSFTNTLLGAKWPVMGVNLNGEQIAYSNDIMKGKGVVQNTVGGEQIVGLYDFDLGFTRVYYAKIDDRNLTFSFDFKNMVLTDEETGSIWNAKGLALDGELAGSQLEQLEAPESFYFCWAAQFPETQVAGVEDKSKINSDSNEE